MNSTILTIGSLFLIILYNCFRTDSSIILISISFIVCWFDCIKFIMLRISDLYGRIEIRNDQMDDLIIRRTDGSPTYNFCVVVDDWDMGITHVVRGEDHINNTPRQINIYEALGAPVPTFAHCAMILGDDGAKLSKRHGAVSVMQYRDMGYLPAALNNYLVRLGWSHGDREIFSQEEMINLFSLNAVSKSASGFAPSAIGLIMLVYGVSVAVGNIWGAAVSRSCIKRINYLGRMLER